MANLVKRTSSYRRKANTLSALHAAYLAGVIDGEGCLTASVNRKSVFGVLEVGSVHRDFAFYFRDMTDVGSVESKKRRTKNAKQLFVWRVSMCSLKTLLPQLIPYLVLKNKQAELMMALLEYWDYPCKLDRSNTFQLGVIQQFRILNKRGQQLA